MSAFDSAVQTLYDAMSAENDKLRAENDHLKSLVSDDVGAVMAPEILEDRLTSLSSTGVKLHQRQDDIIKKMEAELSDYQGIANTYGNGDADSLQEYCEEMESFKDNGLDEYDDDVILDYAEEIEGFAERCSGPLKQGWLDERAKANRLARQLKEVCVAYESLFKVMKTVRESDAGYEYEVR